MKFFAWFNQHNNHDSKKKRNIDNTNVHDTKDHVHDDRNSRKKRNTASDANAPDTKGGEQHDDRNSRKKRSAASNTNIPDAKDGWQRDDRNSWKKRSNAPITKDKQQTGNTRDTRYIPDSVRQEVFERDGRRCANCGSTFYLEFDHIIPLAKGGATSVKNLQVLCRQCNRKKGLS